MIEPLMNLPGNVVGFRATGNVTREDFEQVVLPEVERLVAKTGKLNYLLILDTPLKEFTFGAWMQDVLLGIKHLTQWNRAAIITDSAGLQHFTRIFSALMPGAFRGFDKLDIDVAVDWVSEKSDDTKGKMDFNG
ncbi:SpoIIAA family protein [Taibaiella koreensis]|uniref:STAS/SEC14 domain-containing protein n=1 Tax=Taibaiella koreensis TaxID=1268548 RepID=UPI000E599665|nr:STAS/SEC14 domain-containing protein [Taibaiella koreensis]